MVPGTCRRPALPVVCRVVGSCNELHREDAAGLLAIPQTFENTNLVRNINLDRSYPRETANIVVKNVGSKPASEYYYLFPSDLISHVSGFEVKDRKDPKAGPFDVELARYASPKYISPSQP